VRATDAAGNLSSYSNAAEAATADTTAPTPPTITAQPQSIDVVVGQTATFSVFAAGTAPLSYQWKKNGTNISGAANASYTTPATILSDSGDTFSVTVDNSEGSVTSNTATLTVTAVAASCADTNTRCVGAGQEYASIQAAANAARAGDTVLVSAGTYNEKVSTVRSGTANARITFRASGKVVIKTFSSIGHDYITVDGFEMTAANEGFMMRWNGDYGQLLNNIIHDTGADWGVVDADGNNFYASGNRYYSSTGPGDDLTVFMVGGNNSVVENNEIGPGKDLAAILIATVGVMA
jgi:hypothetical protein